jgi:putative ABC transport system permease protein
MLNGILFGLKKFFSEIGSGDMVILFSSLILSVTAISGVGFLSDRFQRSIQEQASIVLGAEMVFRSGAPIDDHYIQTAELMDIKTAETISFLTMALSDGGNILSSIKAISSTYPLVGNVTVILEGQSKANLDLNQPLASTVWVEQKILEALNISPGESVTLGNKTFKVAGTLIDFPDRSTGFLSFSPTIIANDYDLEEMGVIQAGSRVVYRQLYSAQPSQLESFLIEVEDDLNEVQVQKVSDLEGQLGNSVTESSQFANLAALFTILITLVSSMIAARRYAKRHLLNTTLMKVFGASKKFILWSQISQLIMLILMATFIGCLLGFSVQALLESILSPIINRDLPPPTARPLWLGFLTACCIVIAACGPYLRILGLVEPIRLLRKEDTQGSKSEASIYLFSFLIFGLFLLFLFNDPRLVGSILFALLGLIILLAGIGYLLIFSTKLSPGFGGYGWLMGLRNLSKRSSENLLQIIVFGVSLTFLIVLAETRSDLVNTWRSSLNQDTPNYFFFNIQDYQLNEVQGFFENEMEANPEFTPLIRGRLIGATSASGLPIDVGRMMQRESNLTWFSELPDNNSIKEGSWWDEEDEQRSLISVDGQAAKSMGLSIGDQLEFNVAGENFTVTVKNFREIEWESFSPNFFFVLSPSVAKELPQSYITSLKIDNDSEAVDVFIERFPTITSVDLESAMDQIRTVIDSASTAVQYIFVLSLLAGILTLVASIFSTVEERNKENAVMKAMGAKQSDILQIALAEFGALGLVASITALFVAIGFSAYISIQIFETSYSPNSVIILSGLLGGFFLILLTGMFVVYRALAVPAVQTLRG